MTCLSIENSQKEFAAAARSVSRKPYLGDSEVVGAYVRGFIAGVVQRAAVVGEGAMKRGDAVADDRGACADGTAVFLGEDPAYESMGQWNGAGLINWCFQALPFEKLADSAAQRCPRHSASAC
ncbi:hypothetical protein [Paraburkholderia strydomiana]